MELPTLYAALLAHGTDMDAAQVVRMILDVTKDGVSHMMQTLEDESRQKANRGLLDFYLRHAIVKHWGDGSWVSADMMSLEATRHLWQVRVDPRRRTYAIGIYTHELDQWGIVYDQPIVLNKRQADAAIEGVHQQSIDYLTVDTHG